MTIEVSLAHAFGVFSIDTAFQIEGQGVTALFGASGAGKTTIIKATAGLFRPARGRIVVDGDVLLDTAHNIFKPARRRRVGYVFQDSRLFPHLTVEANLLFGARRAPERTSASEVTEIVALLGLAPLLTRKPAGLSGGEKGRVALGRALLSRPRLLLLDEPLAALDARRKSEIIPYLERLRDILRLPMIYVTHSTEEVARLADHVIVLHDGKIEGQGSVFDLLADPTSGAFVPSQGAVFPATVLGHRSDGLTALSFDGGVILVPLITQPPAAKLRLRVAADDVILARAVPETISANNVLSVRVAGGHVQSATHADVPLRCGGVRLVARITRASYERLAPREGEAIFAVIKAVAVDPQTGTMARGTD